MRFIVVALLAAVAFLPRSIIVMSAESKVHALHPGLNVTVHGGTTNMGFKDLDSSVGEKDGDNSDDTPETSVNEEERGLSKPSSDSRLAKILKNLFKNSKKEKFRLQRWAGANRHVHPLPPIRVKEAGDGMVVAVPRKFKKVKLEDNTVPS